MGDLHDLADRLESVEGGSYWPAPSEPMVVARRIVEARQRDDVTLLRRWRGDWMEWDHGAWFAAEEDAVRSMLYSTLENVNYFAKGRSQALGADETQDRRCCRCTLRSDSPQRNC